MLDMNKEGEVCEGVAVMSCSREANYVTNLHGKCGNFYRSSGEDFPDGQFKLKKNLNLHFLTSGRPSHLILIVSMHVARIALCP